MDVTGHVGLDCAHITYLHRYNLAIPHVLEQDLRVADYKRVRNVERVPGHPGADVINYVSLGLPGLVSLALLVKLCRCVVISA